MEHDDRQFYGSLAGWWPVISPVEDYEEEALYVARLLRTAAAPVSTVLELGCGGGHMAHYLARDFELTLTDLSDDMLNVSRALNPGCRHHVGDMRTLRLDQRFDSVFIHDAVDYMTTERDLARALGTAAAHLDPGGVVLVLPDTTAETFEPGTDISGSDAEDGRSARLFEWTWDPDPDDTWANTEYAFILRSPDGSVTHAFETHRHGVFAEATWLRLMAEAGFDATPLLEETTEDREPRTVFLGQRRTG